MIPFLLVSSSLLWDMTRAHGYLKTPKSRNLMAHEMGAEYDHMSLNNNLGGFFSSSVCGQVQGNGHDYDYPRVSLPTNSLPTYQAGGVITIDVDLTAHHNGHFEFALCDGTAESCFRAPKLQIVADNNYAAPIDSNYPERAMIPPSNYPMQYSYQVQLPTEEQIVAIAQNFYDSDLSVVILHWTYVTANSCRPTGYESYPFPVEWNMQPSPLGDCGPYNLDIPPGVPEVFYNCADVAIQRSGGTGGPPPPVSSPTTPSPVVAPTTPMPVPTPAPQQPVATTTPPSPTGTLFCGGGNVGNGICSNPNHCCSQWGWCGASDDHCGNPPQHGDVCSQNTRCGISWEDANTRCGEPCNGTWNDCTSSGEYCFGSLDMTVCADECP